MSVATCIDFSDELSAAENGECLACRIAGTHRVNAACGRTARVVDMILCGSCGTMYAPSMLRGRYADSGCPECLDRRPPCKKC